MILEIGDIPKFRFTKSVSALCGDIDGILESLGSSCSDVSSALRKATRAKSICSSLEIEGNTLGIVKIREILAGKDVQGSFDDVVEAKNAVKAYSEIDRTDVFSMECFLKIESVMMWGLVEENGFRESKVVVTDGTKIYYEAPDASLVEPMVSRLFEWCRNSGYPMYLTAAIAHYYIESIHPFRDGNGRMGRYWHSAMLRKQDRLFRMVSIENAARTHQQEYYDILERCQSVQDCTEFVEFMLMLTNSALEELSYLLDTRISALLRAMGTKPLSSAQIMDRMGLRDRVNFQTKYLRPAVDHGFVELTDPEHPRNPHQKYRRIVF